MGFLLSGCWEEVLLLQWEPWHNACRAWCLAPVRAACGIALSKWKQKHLRRLSLLLMQTVLLQWQLNLICLLMIRAKQALAERYDLLEKLTPCLLWEKHVFLHAHTACTFPFSTQNTADELCTVPLKWGLSWPQLSVLRTAAGFWRKWCWDVSGKLCSLGGLKYTANDKMHNDLSLPPSSQQQPPGQPGALHHQYVNAIWLL